MSESSEQTGRVPSAVAVDGTRVRTIREEKRLTQLYVASVVGVTTDTISRWENNRYPTIKGDNAVKLAQALEVSLTDIMRKEEAPPQEADEAVPEAEAAAAPAPPSRRKYVAAVTIGLIVVMAAVLLLVRPWSGEDIAAVRKLPRGTAPGMLLPVQISVNRGEGAGGVIIRERLPEGWVLTGAIPPAAGQSTTGEIKWLLPGGAPSTVISYTVRTPAGWPLGQRVSFEGRIAVEHEGRGSSADISGDRQCEVGPIHWADGDGDGRIDDREIMPAYYLTEEMKGLLADWPLVESIWSASGYEWDQQRRQYRVIP